MSLAKVSGAKPSEP